MKFKNLFILHFFFVLIGTGWSQSIYVYKLKDLTFGDVFIGYSKNIRHFDDGAAKFNLHHTFRGRRDVLVTFSLPKNLSNGINYLPIEFNQGNAAWSFRDRKWNRRRFNPNYPLEIRRVRKNKTVYIWLGGEIQTNSNLLPGFYKDTIILTVEFL